MSAGRNDPCPCGSGMKYKKCCLLKEQEEKAKTSPVALARSNSEKKQLIKSSDEFPISTCLINPDWQETGLAWIAVARSQDNGNLVIGVYLVDIQCLGLKNTFSNADLTPERFDEDFLVKCFPERKPAPIGINHAKEIIFGAIDYAGRLGFEPHPDFRLSRHVLGAEELTHQQSIRFGGRDGKPMYVAGPDDDIPRIMRTLTDRLGKDGFHFIAPIGIPRALPF